MTPSPADLYICNICGMEEEFSGYGDELECTFCRHGILINQRPAPKEDE